MAPIIRDEVDMTILEHHYYFDILARQFYIVKRAQSWGPHCGTLVYRRYLPLKPWFGYPRGVDLIPVSLGPCI